MKTVSKILTIILVFQLGNSIAQNEQILIKGNFEALELSGTNVHDLVLIDKEFKGLEKFGNPIDKSFKDNSTEAIWTFNYEDFTLIFIQLSPRGPELLEIIVFDNNADLSLDGNNLFGIKSADGLVNGRSFISGKKIDPALKDHQKFDESIEFLEYTFDKKKLMKIRYKRDLQI